MSVIVKTRTKMKVIRKSGKFYVREMVEGMSDKPLNQGPFDSAMEASQFLTQRAEWIHGLLNHMQTHAGKNPIPPYPPFIFYFPSEL